MARQHQVDRLPRRRHRGIVEPALGKNRREPRRVRHAHAGAGSGILTTIQQTANASGVALIGLIYFTVLDAISAQTAILAAPGVLSTLILCAAFSLRWMRSGPPRLPVH
jgi:hypothetical protein